MEHDEKDVDYFLAKFHELADDAYAHGHAVACVIENNNPITFQVGVLKVMKGNPLTLIGLLQHALWDYQFRR